ncbi:MAG: 16S rRNA (uracil(1498)-N(3))-methyltransferase [Bacteroidales bacterium]|nr:16S rRNA (uracil(1498)-N(3))-methyltransferase [Bacteroidales bacterium]
MQLFYHQSAESESKFTFNKEESGHIVRVLRKQTGDIIYITNGKGALFPARIIDDRANKVKVALLEAKHHSTRDFSIHIAVAPTKNIKRTEWFVEKAVETGIEKISFFTSRHSERQNIKADRMQKVAIAAMKQSQKTYLPEITGLKSFHDTIRNAKESKKWIAHCISERNRQIAGPVPPASSHIVLIGPEGGFHTDEILEAEQIGFQPVELSPYRLRTETAALNACQWLNYENFNNKR